MSKLENDIAISINNVSMHFNIASEIITGIKEYIIKMVQRRLFFKDFIAVDDVTFDVCKGEVFGIIGTNGSGKSTLLKIISGILEPTSGRVVTNGKIAPLIELGAGFDGDLTARENIFLNGAILGYEKDFLEEKFTEIVDFAELWDFLEMPIKNYSSGMIARIAFSIATIVKPDILIVDEILSVGDFLFQQKCEKRIKELMEGGTTVLIVSHSIDQIEQLCDRVLWIEKSKPRMIGSAVEVCNAFRNLENERKMVDQHKYQIVSSEKCHICGNLVDFRDEIGMTYKSESFCSYCGANLKVSDLMGMYLINKFGLRESSLREIDCTLHNMKMLVCGNEGTLYSELCQYSGFYCTNGSWREICEEKDTFRNLGIDKASLDLIILEELLMYIPNPEITIQELVDLLKPGGNLIVNLPLYENINTISRIGLKHKIYNNGLLINTQWGLDIKNILEKYGLEVKMECTHKWYNSDEQPNLDKKSVYEKFMDTHPYYFYKFNCWPIYCIKK